MKILVVDDEKVLVKGLKFNLEADGYTVDTAYDGLEAVDKARANHYDLIMMDVMMPQLDGLEACMRIRDFSQVPIIMLTARSDDMDKLMGFEYGVDDYITKPFNILEVKARVRALLRRSAIASDAAGGSDTLIEHGGIKIDTEKRTAFKNNAPVELTAKEYELIELLIKHPGRVYSRDSLLNLSLIHI